MKILTCPINGSRPIQEFFYGGELRDMPNPTACSDEKWGDYVFNRSGEPGIRFEWWYHLASSVWFIAERDIVRDEVIRTFLWKQKR